MRGALGGERAGTPGSERRCGKAEGLATAPLLSALAVLPGAALGVGRRSPSYLSPIPRGPP